MALQAQSWRQFVGHSLSIGFLILTGGLIGLVTIQPRDSTSAIAFSGLVGLGFSASLALISARVQLSTPVTAGVRA
jgi:hypothetical protein